MYHIYICNREQSPIRPHQFDRWLRQWMEGEGHEDIEEPSALLKRRWASWIFRVDDPISLAQWAGHWHHLTSGARPSPALGRDTYIWKIPRWEVVSPITWPTWKIECNDHGYDTGSGSVRRLSSALRYCQKPANWFHAPLINQTLLSKKKKKGSDTEHQNQTDPWKGEKGLCLLCNEVLLSVLTTAVSVHLSFLTHLYPALGLRNRPYVNSLDEGPVPVFKLPV